MKNILLAFVLLSMSFISQNGLVYTGIIETKQTKEVMYKNALLWFSSTFKNAKDVIELQDKENYTIVGKGNFPYTSVGFFARATASGHIDFTLKLFFKDYKFKYEFSDFYHFGSYADGYEPFNIGLITTDAICPHKFPDGTIKSIPEKNWPNIKSIIESNVSMFLDGLKNDIQKNNDNW